MNEHKNLGVIAIVSGVLIIVFAAFFFIILPIMMKPKVSLWLGNSVFSVDAAIDESSRIKGLSGVSELAPNRALLMAFPSESKWGIWTKDMKIPIDIIWLDNNKKVIYIVKNASPETSTSQMFEPNTLARYVIEFSAGTVDNSAINIGSSAIFQIDEGGIN